MSIIPRKQVLQKTNIMGAAEMAQGVETLVIRPELKKPTPTSHPPTSTTWFYTCAHMKQDHRNKHNKNN